MVAWRIGCSVGEIAECDEDFLEGAQSSFVPPLLVAVDKDRALRG